MCLYTCQRAPVDLTGTPAWKIYKDRVQKDGSLALLTPYRSVYVRSLTQTAYDCNAQPTMPEIFPGDYIISGGYIHAFTSFDIALDNLNDVVDDTRDQFESNYYIISGTLSGMGYRSTFEDDICAERFIMDEIEHFVDWV